VHGIRWQHHAACRRVAWQQGGGGMPDFVILILMVNLSMIVALLAAYLDSFGDDIGKP
jgi:hypothetical protein